MSVKNIAKLMAAKGLTEDQVRRDIASKKSLKDNINDFLDEKNNWVSFNDLLSASKRWNFNKGEEITERGLKIMLSRMRDTAEIFRSDDSGFWWTTVTSDATTFPVTAIPSEWKGAKKQNKSSGNGLGVRGKRASSPDKFYFTILNALNRGDKVPESTIKMARLDYANILSIQLGGTVKLDELVNGLIKGESQRINTSTGSVVPELTEEDDKELEAILASAAFEDETDNESDESEDNSTEEE